MKNDYDIINDRYIKACAELKEHQRVLESLNGLEDDRIAYRIIGEVLAKQTVKEVRPNVEQFIKSISVMVA